MSRQGADHPGRPSVRPKGKAQDPSAARRPSDQLPQRLDRLETLGREEFVPRLAAITRVMLDEPATIDITRGDMRGMPGVVFIDVVFGRQDGRPGCWSGYLVRVELDAVNNQVCMQAGQKSHLNRAFSYGDANWDSRLIEGFEWILSKSMRPHLFVRVEPGVPQF